MVGQEKKEITCKLTSGWRVVFTDRSAKVVHGWGRAGFGGWYGPGDPANYARHVPLGERQSNNRAELWAVLHALRGKNSLKAVARGLGLGNQRV